MVIYSITIFLLGAIFPLELFPLEQFSESSHSAVPTSAYTTAFAPIRFAICSDVSLAINTVITPSWLFATSVMTKHSYATVFDPDS